MGQNYPCILIGSKKLPFYGVKAVQDLSLHSNKGTSYSCITHNVTKFYVTHTMNSFIHCIDQQMHLMKYSKLQIMKHNL